MHFVSIALHRSSMLVVSFIIMSSKKNSHKRLCPGCKLAAPAHELACWISPALGLVQRKARTALKPLTPLKHLRLVHNATLSNQLLNYCRQLDRSLTTEIDKIQLEQSALKDEIKHLGKGSPESSRCNTQATTCITLPLGNNLWVHTRH